MIIYSPTDRIPVKIEDVTFWISPLKQLEKLKLAEISIKAKGAVEIEDKYEALRGYIRYSVKDVEGLTRPNGKPYKVTLDKDGYLTDASVDALMTLGISDQLITASSALYANTPINQIKGVEIDLKSIKYVKKK